MRWRVQFQLILLRERNIKNPTTKNACLHTLHTCLHTYLDTYLNTYLHTCILINLHTYLHTNTYLRTCILIYIHTYLFTYIHTCIHTDILSYILLYLHTYLHTSLLTYIRTYVRADETGQLTVVRISAFESADAITVQGIQLLFVYFYSWCN